MLVMVVDGVMGVGLVSAFFGQWELSLLWDCCSSYILMDGREDCSIGSLLHW